MATGTGYYGLADPRSEAIVAKGSPQTFSFAATTTAAAAATATGPVLQGWFVQNRSVTASQVVFVGPSAAECFIPVPAGTATTTTPVFVPGNFQTLFARTSTGGATVSGYSY